MIRLTKQEKDELVTNCDRFERLKHSSALPRAFTEQGVAMLASVLKSIYYEYSHKGCYKIAVKVVEVTV